MQSKLVCVGVLAAIALAPGCDGDTRAGHDSGPLAGDGGSSGGAQTATWSISGAQSASFSYDSDANYDRAAPAADFHLLGHRIPAGRAVDVHP